MAIITSGAIFASISRYIKFELAEQDYGAKSSEGIFKARNFLSKTSIKQLLIKEILFSTIKTVTLL